MKTGKNSATVFSLPGWASSGPRPLARSHRPDEQHQRHHQDERRRPVLDRAQEIHSAVDDEDVQAPEEQERQPFGRRVAADPAAEQIRPAGNDGAEERLQRFAADPRLDAEPAAGHERPHQRGKIRTDRAVGDAREDWKRDAVLRPWMGVEQDWNEDDGVAEEDGDERLPPVHAARHQPRREHVGRDAVRHADPQRRVVVGRPGACGERNRREVVVVERAALDARRVP